MGTSVEQEPQIKVNLIASTLGIAVSWRLSAAINAMAKEGILPIQKETAKLCPIGANGRQWNCERVLSGHQGEGRTLQYVEHTSNTSKPSDSPTSTRKARRKPRVFSAFSWLESPVSRIHLPSFRDKT